MNKNDNVSNNVQNKKYRVIFHIDMNCFFASCHIAENPSLAGIPLVVAHNDEARKSIILTASYEARKYGIYTTMLTRDAIKLCPRVKIVEPNYRLYEKYSNDFLLNSLISGLSNFSSFCIKTEKCSFFTSINKSLISSKDFISSDFFFEPMLLFLCCLYFINGSSI